MKRLPAAVAAAATLLAFTPTPAHAATTGGIVCNSLNSKHNLWVSATRPATNQVMVPIGRCSYHVGVSNVQSWLSGWSQRTQYGFVWSGGAWHYMSVSGVQYVLTVLP